MTNNFIECSIRDALSFFKQSIFADECAMKSGFCQSLDPRIKTITFLLFIVLTVLTKNIQTLFCLYASCLVLTIVSKINPWFFIKRTWIFIPLFSLFIAIPSLFSIFTPGQSLIFLDVFGVKLTITHQGFFSAFLFVLRVTTSVSFTVLLTITTRHFELLRVLRVFGVPQIFVMTVGMCYRYIFLFVEILENTHLAVKSRIGLKVNYKRGHHLVAWNIASLWHRSYQLNENVYKAMLSRGYNGDAIVMDNFRWRSMDWLWLCVVVLFFIHIIYQ